ncbi:MAG: replication-relaxation family protein [Chloroflexi bacterium]|nr:replication-relaxation family protein [Chloroflexota bacterium]
MADDNGIFGDFDTEGEGTGHPMHGMHGMPTVHTPPRVPSQAQELPAASRVEGAEERDDFPAALAPQTSDASSPSPSGRRHFEADVDSFVSNITDRRGYLLRQRPGSSVAVGPAAALLLSDGLTDREIAAMKFVEQLGVVTAEQLARAFFNTTRSAYETLQPLVRRRFLANIGADPAQIRRAVGHRPPPRNPAYILDWNGAYHLSTHHDYELRNWRPSTVALITSRFAHNLGISEVWSYLLAASRATHELNLVSPSEDLWRYRLSLGLRNERASLLTQRGAREAADSMMAADSLGALGSPGYPGSMSGQERAKVRDRVLLQPDATFILAIREMGEQAALPPDPQEPPVGSVGAAHGAPHAIRPGHDDRSPSPRWNPASESWEPAILSDPPYGAAMAVSEKLAARNHQETYYRALLLEMETGANNSKDVINKITAYNRLIRTNELAWTGAFGIGPRLLVVTRTALQIDALAKIWRTHYFHSSKETSVLMTSLQTLARVYGAHGRSGRGDRRALIEQPCWLDVMAAGAPAWMTLGEALRVGVVMRTERRRTAGIFTGTSRAAPAKPATTIGTP